MSTRRTDSLTQLACLLLVGSLAGLWAGCGGASRNDGPINSELELELLIEDDAAWATLDRAVSAFENAGLSMLNDFQRYFAYELYRDAERSFAIVCGSISEMPPNIEDIRPYGPRGFAVMTVDQGHIRGGRLPTTVTFEFSTRAYEVSHLFQAQVGAQTCVFLRDQLGPYQLWRNAFALAVIDGDVDHGALRVPIDELLDALEGLYADDE